jgi:hypothetical protein
METPYLDKIAEKLHELGRFEHLHVTSSRPIRELYRNFKETCSQEFVDSVRVRNSPLDGLSMKFTWKGISFEFVAVKEDPKPKKK